MIAVSPDAVDRNTQVVADLKLSFPVLADAGMVVTDLFGLRHTKAIGEHDLPYPTTFVLAGDGTVLARFENASYRERPDPTLVVAALS